MPRPIFGFSVNEGIVSIQKKHKAYPKIGSRDDFFKIFKSNKQRFHEINYYKVRLQVGGSGGIRQLKKINKAGIGCLQPICGTGNNCGAYCNTSSLSPYCALSWGATDNGWSGLIMGSSCGDQWINCSSNCGLESCSGCNC